MRSFSVGAECVRRVSVRKRVWSGGVGVSVERLGRGTRGEGCAGVGAERGVGTGQMW